MMPLKTLFDIIGDPIDMKVLYGDLDVYGTKESLQCLLSAQVTSSIVKEIQPRDNVLWVWLV